MGLESDLELKGLGTSWAGARCLVVGASFSVR